MSDSALPKVALITGGSSGLGLAMARRLHRDGYQVILVARDLDRLAAAKADIESSAAGPEVHTHSCDVADDAAMTALFERLRAQFAKLDLLIVNAGVASIDLLRDYGSLSAINQNLAVNLLGPIACTYLADPLLVRGSRVLYVSSGFAYVGPAGYALYATAKAGLNNFAEAMRRELLGRGVSVHLTCPADIDTPMLAGELRIMPAWMKQSTGRAKPMPADAAARYILDRCLRGDYLITPTWDVAALRFAQRLLPVRAFLALVDRILPLPPTSH